MPKETVYDRVATSLATWLQETPVRVAELWIGDGPAPFAAKVSTKELLAYYDRRFFNPDGTPNVPGRQDELARIGIAGYAETMRQVMKYRDTGMAADVDLEELLPSTGTPTASPLEAPVPTSPVDPTPPLGAPPAPAPAYPGVN
jgi:hypothetical protein